MEVRARLLELEATRDRVVTHTHMLNNALADLTVPLKSLVQHSSELSDRIDGVLDIVSKKAMTLPSTPAVTGGASALPKTPKKQVSAMSRISKSKLQQKHSPDLIDLTSHTPDSVTKARNMLRKVLFLAQASTSSYAYVELPSAEDMLAALADVTDTDSDGDTVGAPTKPVKSQQSSSTPWLSSRKTPTCQPTTSTAAAAAGVGSDTSPSLLTKGNNEASF